MARLGRADAGLLHAEIGRGGLAVLGHVRTDGRSLTTDDRPAPGASDVLTRAAADIEGYDTLQLVLPGAVTTTLRMEADDRQGGRVTAARLSALLAAGRRRAAGPGTAVLSCRVVGTVLDGTPVAEPVGHEAGTISARLTAVTAPVSALKRFEDAVAAAGLTLAGVVSAPEAVGAALLPSGEGSAVLVGEDGILAVSLTGGSLAASAFVPIGRRHLRGDLMLAFEIEEGAAEERLARLLEGRADTQAERVVRPRLAEIGEMVRAAAEGAGVPMRDVLLSGVPPRTLPGFEHATGASRPDVPAHVAADPTLLGAAYLTLGLRGHTEVAEVAATPPPRIIDWLRRRF